MSNWGDLNSLVFGTPSCWLNAMRKCLLFCFFIGWVVCSLQATQTDAARELICRVTHNVSFPVSLKISKQGNDTYYHYAVTDGVLSITASDNVSLCRGFYDYVKSNGWGLYTWSGNNMQLPVCLPEHDSVAVISPFANHYYFNVCTYGYTMPYWNWERWEKEIDWMALHGVNMPLALVGYEAILARVWEKMGLTDEEINSYFVGPAHLPWMRMGNICGVDGPLDADWHADQIALQHKILDRMRSLGMKPICPGFAGFITEAFKRLYPDLKIVETHWGGAFHNWMVSPAEPLFSEISEAFIHEWEKEFGKCGYYLVDSFNEMDIPFPEKGKPARYEMAADYGEKVYQSIRKANKEAVWVMQGWMFGYQRHIWDVETLGALVSRVPDQKLMLLDLAVDYNKHFWHSEVNWEYYHGFFNKQWVYSVIPNMGGKTGMTGVLDFYANGHLDALQSVRRGNLVAQGCAPEGIENNEVVYELVTDAGWSNEKIDIRRWLYDYSRNRYGQVPASLTMYWELLLKSVYGTFTDHPRFNWQFRPGSVNDGSICMNEDYFAALEQFAASADSLSSSNFYLTDLCEMMAHYLGGKSEILIKQIDQEYLLGDTVQAQFLQKRFETLMLGMDILLRQHPNLRLDRWVEFATGHAQNEIQKRRYETNAKRIVTVWGPPVDDYSARIWSGLVKDYYLERWKRYFEARESGKQIDLSKWELSWVEQEWKKPVNPEKLDIVDFSRRMLALSRDIKAGDVVLNRSNLLATWNLKAQEEKIVELMVPARILGRLTKVTLECLRGEGLEAEGFELVADGVKVALSNEKKETIDGKLSYQLSLPDGMNANNGCQLRLKLKSGAQRLAGVVLYAK